MDAKRSTGVIQALAQAINELKRARQEIGDIKPDDDFIWTELSYMLVNTYKNLEGFLKAKLEGQQTKKFD